jgi:hypothetical protein
MEVSMTEEVAASEMTEDDGIGVLMEKAWLACQEFNVAMKVAGVNRAERRRAMRFATTTTIAIKEG